MADPYLVPDDFRDGSFNAACAGLTLSDDEANDIRLTAVIQSVSQRVNDICDDRFSQEPGDIVDVDVTSQSNRLYLPRRCTTVSTLFTRDHTGTLTVHPSAVFRLRSSLDTAGAIALYDTDYIELLYWSAGLSGPDIFYPFIWPPGTKTVEVIGDFGWIVTPGDVKRCVALLVWDIFKREAGDVRRASRWARGDLTVERATDTITGLPEADDLLKPFIRSGYEDSPLVLIS